MKIQVFLLVQLLGCLHLSASAFAAEQRVLLRFDNAGHQVSRIVRPQTAEAWRRNENNSSSREQGLRVDIQTLISSLEPGVALLLWTDDDGYSQARTTEPDPRVSHAPAHITGSEGSKLGNISGAWLVSGPDSATGVTILLPSHPVLGLAFEQWQVSLSDW